VTINGHASSAFYFLADSAFKSEALAHASIPVSLAGRARGLYELSAGTNPFPNESPATPFNPQGNLGHDHSGPPWGSAFLHPIATFSGKANNAGSLQQIDGAQPVVQPASSALQKSIGPWVIGNRLFAKIPPPSGSTAGNLAPYSRGLVRGVAHRTGAGTVTLSVTLVTLDYKGHQVSSMSSSVSLSSSSETAFSIDDAWFPLVPGRNALRMDFSCSSASAGIVVDAIGVYQTVKRSH
jgi:hypothetical protein